MVAVQLTIPT